MSKAGKYCNYPVCRILYKTDNTQGWYMAEKSGSVEECQKICEEKKKNHTWTDYECTVDVWYSNEIDIPLRKYEPEASDLHRRTLLIYNPDDKKYYYPDEAMPYPQKNLLRPSNKFCITAKTEPANDKECFINDLLETEDDFVNTAARLYFNNKLGIVVISKYVMEDIPAFLNKLNSSGYSNLIIEEYWYTKFLAWKKNGNIRFIIQNYNDNDVEITFDKQVPEHLFFNEFNKLCQKLKEGLQKVRKLHKQFRQEEELLKSLPWIYDTKNKNEILQEYIDIGSDCIKSRILNSFVAKVKDNSSPSIIDWDSKKKEICMHQGDFFYKVRNHKLIRFYYSEGNNREISRYIKTHDIKINSSLQLAKLYSDMVKNSGREAIDCYLGENKATIYEDGGFEAPLSTPKEKEHLADTIYQIVKDKDKNEFLIDEFHNLLKEYGIKTSSRYSDRMMRISCAETYTIPQAREKELIAAAEAGDLERIKTLLSKGADVNYANYKYDTALSKAVSCGHLEITKLLLKHGADIEAVDYEGVSVLMHAAFNNNDSPAIAKILIDSGCNVAAKSNAGQTALDYAEANSNTKIAEYLRAVMKKAKETSKHYDTIDFRIQPAGTLEIPWADCNRVVILINEQEIKNIVREKEKEFFAACGLDVESAGCYHYLWPSSLYAYLQDAQLSCGKNKAPILCCTCDEVGCASVKVCVEYTKDSVIWKNFESCRKEWNWGLEYEFETEAYEEFMQRIKALSDC